MVAEPQIVEMLESFDDEGEGDDSDFNHHEDTDAFELRYRKDAVSFKEMIEEAGSPFVEEDLLINVANKVVQSAKAVESVRNAKDIGLKAYNEFVQKRLITCEESIYKTITNNKLQLFREKNTLPTNKGKLKTTSLSQERKMYALLYIASQAREGDLDDFFQHENHSHPPSLSEYGKLRKSNKSDFLKCLEDHGGTKIQFPEVTAEIIDGAAAVQMIKPEESKTFGQYCKEEFPS